MKSHSRAGKGLGTTSRTVQADMRNLAGINRMVETVLDEFGRVDILVNNSGVLYHGPFIESNEAEWRDELEVNIFGPLCA
ncbi:MAG: SDR family NAD(P)-dependent oxidoreductase [Thermomicrobiales bacterium]